MQTVEVKAMAQNAGVYMRSVRSRHLRSVLKEPVNQKAPLCHNERRVIDDVVWSFRLSCSNRRRLLIYFTFVFSSFFLFKNQISTNQMWFKACRFSGSLCQMGQRWALHENRLPGSRCHLSEMLPNLRFIPVQKLQKEHSRLQPSKLTHTSPA